MLDDVALLIVGYDPYKDVWDDYFTLLNKYWADRPKTYLATNSLEPDYNGVKVISSGDDAEWSKKVQTALEIIPEEYIILLLEDFFTTSAVSNKTLNDLMQIIRNNQIDYCKLLNQSRIRGEKFDNKKYLHIIRKEDKYGISLQPAIWNKAFLKELVGVGNYNAWIFELNQIDNCYQNQTRINCLADDRNILKITHAVVQSTYLNSAIRTFRRQGYEINTETIKPMKKSKEIKYRLKQFFSDYTPKFIFPFARRVGRIMKIDYVTDRVKRKD